MFTAKHTVGTQDLFVDRLNENSHDGSSYLSTQVGVDGGQSPFSCVFELGPLVISALQMQALRLREANAGTVSDPMGLLDADREASQQRNELSLFPVPILPTVLLTTGAHDCPARGHISQGCPASTCGHVMKSEVTGYDHKHHMHLPHHFLKETALSPLWAGWNEDRVLGNRLPPRKQTQHPRDGGATRQRAGSRPAG